MPRPACLAFDNEDDEDGEVDDEPGGEYGGQPGQDWRAGKEQTCGHLDSLTLFDSWLKDHLHVHEKDAENGEGCGVDDVDKTLSGQHPVKKSCCL